MMSQKKAPKRGLSLSFVNALIFLMSIGTLLVSFGFYEQSQNIDYAAYGYPNEEGTTIPAEPTIQRIPVVIAVQNIPHGTPITPDRIAVVLYPIDAIPADSFQEIEFVVNKIAATDIYTNELILSRKLVDSLDSLGSYGSDIAAIIEPDYMAMSVEVPANLMVSGATAGDRVDFIYPVTQDGEMTTIIIPDMQVLYTGQVPEHMFVPTATPQSRNGSNQAVTNTSTDEMVTLTVSITRQDALAVDWATRQGISPRVILHSPRSQELEAVVPINADTIIQLYGQQ